MTDKDRVLTLAEAEKAADKTCVVVPVEDAGAIHWQEGPRINGRWFFRDGELLIWDDGGVGTAYPGVTKFRVVNRPEGVTLTDILAPEKEPGRFGRRGEPLEVVVAPEPPIYRLRRADREPMSLADLTHYAKCVNAMHEAAIKEPGELAGFIKAARVIRRDRDHWAGAYAECTGNRPYRDKPNAFDAAFARLRREG